jgi:hypothetical protein
MLMLQTGSALMTKRLDASAGLSASARADWWAMSQMTRRLELLDSRLLEKRGRMERQMLLVQVQQMLLVQVQVQQMLLLLAVTVMYCI